MIWRMESAFAKSDLSFYMVEGIAAALSMLTDLKLNALDQMTTCIFITYQVRARRDRMTEAWQ